ncbi:methyltransferase domain-containing protein [candidate division KSB1 bacterium]
MKNGNDGISMTFGVVPIDPASAPAWNSLGVAALHDGRFEEAESCFQKACETDPGFIEAAVNLANFYFSRKRYDNAEKLFAYLSQEFPGNAGYFLRRGDCFITFAEYNSALTCYKAAAELEPDNDAGYNRLNLVSSALAAVPFAVSRYPENAPVSVALGRGLDDLRNIFSGNGFRIISGDRPPDIENSPQPPVDFTIEKDNIAVFNKALPSVCRIAVVDTPDRLLSLSEYEKAHNAEGHGLSHIDFILCPDGQVREELLEKQVCAPYQAVVMRTAGPDISCNPEKMRTRLLEFLAEMVLFYAQRLEIQDRHEEAFWLLGHAVRHLSDIPEINQKYRSVSETIGHLRDTDEYHELYDESARSAAPLYDASHLKRYDWLLNQVRSFPGISSLVDIGCHTGEFCFPLAREGFDVTGIDLSARNIQYARAHLEKTGGFSSRVRFFAGNAGDIDKLLLGKRFDGALLLEILEHVPDVETALDTVEKIVKPGGYLFITVPYTHLEMLYNIIFQRKRKYPEHVRRFTPENIPVYFRNKKDLFSEEITAPSGVDELKWLGIRYRVA